MEPLHIRRHTVLTKHEMVRHLQASAMVERGGISPSPVCSFCWSNVSMTRKRSIERILPPHDSPYAIAIRSILSESIYHSTSRTAIISWFESHHDCARSGAVSVIVKVPDQTPTLTLTVGI
jgi:hypothetical protein